MSQSVTINAYKDNELLGMFIITSEEDASIENNEIKDNIKLVNVPIVSELESKDPIIYSELNEFANLCFLEETDYKVFFKTKKNNVQPFYSLLKFGENKVLDLYDFKDEFKGSMRFSSYVGKTYIDIYEDEKCIFTIPIEIRSTKMDYDKHYAQMIGDLSQYASGLIYELNSPLFQSTEWDYEIDLQSPYEQFMILEYIFSENNLPTTVQYLSRNLYSSLETCVEEVPIFFASNCSPDDLIEAYVDSENLYRNNKTYIPLNINETKYQDTIDVSENRFYKYFLETLSYLIEDLGEVIETGYAHDKLMKYKKEVDYYLSHRYFSDISRIDYLPLNSQVLQKKEGYRDILSYFLMLEFGFKLKWNDLTSEFKGNEKRVYKLYEYWCYFELIRILTMITEDNEVKFDDIFKISKKTHTISLKEELEKSFKKEDIEISLLYNQTFYSNNNEKYHTYSVEFRPDYTIVIQKNSKKYFIHFDAKYKKTKGEMFIDSDIGKMHSYKDAIKNTIGAYVLYPGYNNKIYYENEFKSVGALGLIPGEEEFDEILELICNLLKI